MADIVFAFDPAIDRPVPRLDGAVPAVAEPVASAPFDALRAAAAAARQAEAAARMPTYRLPAVWLPFDKAGRSPGNPMWLPAGAFGPFAGQCLVPDQYAATIARWFGADASALASALPNLGNFATQDLGFMA